jgi:hypothetical protein
MSSPIMAILLMETSMGIVMATVLTVMDTVILALKFLRSY